MKRAFFDATTRRLKAYGYAKTNGEGDIALDVPEDFEVEPGKVRLAADGKSLEPALATPVENIVKIETENPIPHRADREKALTDDYIMRALRAKINALDAELAAITGRAKDPLPEIPVSHGLRAVKTVDDAIKAERARL